jgi:hypothetical protein
MLQFNVKVLQFVSSLTPQTKATLKSIFDTIQHYNLLDHLQSIALYAYKTGKDVYPKVMGWGTTDVNKWKQPSSMILQPLSFTVLFLFPADLDLNGQLIDSKTVFVGNQQTYGLQTLVVACKLYKETAIWPRSCVDTFGYKIPLVKHLLEYLGCCKLENLSQVLETNCTTIVYPGGWREQLKNSQVEKYKLDFEHTKLVELVDGVRKNGNRVLPLANIGIEDMLDVMVDLPTPYDTTLPVIVPVSYQKQYLTIGNEITQWDNQVVYVPLLKSCFETIQHCQEHQRRDSERFPLEPFWRRVNIFKEYLERRMGGEELVGQTGTKLKRKVSRLVQQGVERVLETSTGTGRRVTIEELEE